MSVESLMEPELECKIRVYYENDLKTHKRTIFEMFPNINMIDKEKWRIADEGVGGIYIEIDIFDPVATHLEYLTSEVARHLEYLTSV